MERFIHLKGRLAEGRGHIHPRGLETSLKLLVQDAGGRRRERLNSQALLRKKTASKTAGGATVVCPASQALLKAQRLYCFLLMKN